jgi:hypothetical protein
MTDKQEQLAAVVPAIETRQSPVQLATQIVQELVMGGNMGREGQAVNDIHQQMQHFAMAKLRTEGWEANLREGNPDFVLTPEYVLAEEREDTDLALAYWEGTSLFFRKVFQAAAAAA